MTLNKTDDMIIGLSTTKLFDKLHCDTYPYKQNEYACLSKMHVFGFDFNATKTVRSQQPFYSIRYLQYLQYF